jgi:hypothetical protein
MSWSITTISKIRSFSGIACASLAIALAGPVSAQELSVPRSVAAGSDTTISTTGSGSANFYLVGPGLASKQDVTLGQDIHLAGDELQYAGEYQAILCSSTCNNATFFVTAAPPASLAFLVHPSRVPVHQPDAVSGVALVFDKFDNLVLAPTSIDFQVKGAGETLLSRAISTHDGEAWFRTSSGKAAGAVRLTASVGDLTAQRALQEVASDPCNLRIKAQQSAKGIDVETDPVRDCAGNPVPDGTIVTFTGSDPQGKISIDAPIKGDVARARMNIPGPVVLSAACGVALGNELRIDQRQ